MDAISGFDLELDKEVYHPGELIRGNALVSAENSVKVRGIAVTLRGRVQVQWKVIKNAAVYTVRNCKTLLDQKKNIWGHGDNEEFSADLPVLTAGVHRVPFTFQLEADDFASSFESRLGTIRYYLHAVMDIPYSSPPQTVKYFTVITRDSLSALHHWMVPIRMERHQQSACIACSRGAVSLQVALSRTAFCCGEAVPLQLDVTNGSNVKLWPVIQLIQTVLYYVDRSGLGVKKEVTHIVWQYTGPVVPRYSSLKLENLSHVLVVPAMPPSLDSSQSRLCDIIHIDYKLNVYLSTHKWGEPVRMTLPILITSHYPLTAAAAGVMPADDRTSSQPASVSTYYKPAINTVEGGNYISPELQIGGDVYAGDGDTQQNVIIYQPVYQCVKSVKSSAHPALANNSHQIHQSTTTTITTNKQPPSGIRKKMAAFSVPTFSTLISEIDNSSLGETDLIAGGTADGGGGNGGGAVSSYVDGQLTSL